MTIGDDFTFDFGEPTPARTQTVSAGMLTPTDVHGQVNRALRSIESGWVEGEVQGYKGRNRNGHCYFEIADDDKSIPVAIWKYRWADAVGDLDGELRNGQLVQVHFAKLDMFAHGGRVSLHVDEVRLTGEGELLRRRQQTLERLKRDGFCDPARRRTLPWLPRRIAVIAGYRSDAMLDVTKAITDRWPAARIVQCAATVQGAQAVGSMIDALATVQSLPDVDVVVLARGGGSVQDLVAFDDERLCKALVACALPVVVSVAHTAQRPNVYHVADASADVPGKVAELIVPSVASVQATIDTASATLARRGAQITTLAERVDETASRLHARQRLAAGSHVVDQTAARIVAQTTTRLHGAHQQVGVSAGGLNDARRRIPTVSSLDVVAARLRHDAHSFFTSRDDELQAQRDRLHAGAERIPRPQQLDGAAERMRAASRVARASMQMTDAQITAASTSAARSAARIARDAAELVDIHGRNVSRRRERMAERVHERLDGAIGALQARDWRSRGYGMIRGADGELRTSAAQFASGETATVELADGTIHAVVNEIEMTEEQHDG